MLIWEQGNEVPSVPQALTRRSVFLFCEKLVGHFPVIKWLRVAASFIKRRAADITRGWDDEVTDVPLTTMITEVVARVRQKDPVRGKGCVDGPEPDIWIDASSLATGVSLEHDGAVVEDASWLRKERDTQHINLAELDAALNGINMACHVRDLRPVIGLDTLERGCDSELSTQSARVITINETRSDPLEANTAHITDGTSADESFEEEVVLPRRSARRKR